MFFFLIVSISPRACFVTPVSYTSLFFFYFRAASNSAWTCSNWFSLLFSSVSFLLIISAWSHFLYCTFLYLCCLAI